MKKILIGLIVLLVLLPVFASAATYYVSTTGSDTNPGTQTQPWKTIQKAVDSATPGSTIFVRNGTYMESVKITVAGTASLPINLTHYPDEKAVINGGSSRALYFSTQTPKYWIIDGLSFYSTNDVTVLWDSWGCNGTCNGIDHMTFTGNFVSGPIQIYGAYNLIENNEVDGRLNDGNSGNGIHDLYDVSHHNAFRNNIVHDFSARGIWSMHRTHDNLFEGNTVHDVGMGIDLDGYGQVEWRHIIRNNTIYDCGLMGIELENTFDSLIENNVIHDVVDHGIDIISYGRNIPANGTGYGTWPTAPRCKPGGENNQYGDTNGDNDCEGDLTNNIIRQNLLYNIGLNGGFICYHAGGIKLLGNTIVGNSGSKWGIRLDNSAYCRQIEMRSNIITNHSESEIVMSNYTSFALDSNNLFFNSLPNRIYQLSNGKTYWIYQSLSQYQNASGKGQGSLVADPQFVNSAGSDFHLKPASPAIDHGADTGLTSDLDGISRPQGAGYDIGAFEYQGSVSCVAADLNCDTRIDVADLSIVASDFGKTSGYNSKSDTNTDGIVDIFDVVFVASRFT